MESPCSAAGIAADAGGTAVSFGWPECFCAGDSGVLEYKKAGSLKLPAFFIQYVVFFKIKEKTFEITVDNWKISGYNNHNNY